MRFPWANIALIVLFAFELVTGYLGLTHNNPEWIAAMHLHRITGFAILALFLWKSRNILGSFRTRQNWQRVAGDDVGVQSVLLAGLLAVLGLGLAWSHFGPYSLAGLLRHHHPHHPGPAADSPAGCGTRCATASASECATRQGGATSCASAASMVAGLALWQADGQAEHTGRRPGGLSKRFTGSHPENGPDFPVTMWLNDRTQYVDGSQWRLRVNGHVDNPYELGLEELQAWDAKLTATLDCTGGWYTTREWQGVPVPELLALARPRPGAGSITIRSRTGYFRRYSMDEAARALLASRVDGAPLSPGHGFPARMVEPHKRGYDWVKWVEEITVNDTGKFWQPPLPLT